MKAKACMKLLVILLPNFGALASLWPAPAHATLGSLVSGVIPIKGFFELVQSVESPLMEAAFLRYLPLIFPHRLSVDAAAPALCGMVFAIEDLDESHPQLETDESYSLSIDVPTDESCKGKLKAKTVYGALRGLETFSQIIRYDFDLARYVIEQLPINIVDSPRFPHRGLMIDTARHFQTLASIRTIIDSLPYAKLNVLHWHISDTQSFPLESRSSPRLWEGSFSKQERYTQWDIADMVEYARLRGVRIIVELDMPGHAESWCTGYPDICPSAHCMQPLNVASDATFDVIKALLFEMTGGKASSRGVPFGLFPDNFIHLGGDEVNTSCWAESPSISAWLKSKHMSLDDAYAYFVKKAADMAISQGRRPIQWSEVFDHFKGKLDKRTIVHVWLANSNVTEVVSLGYNLIRNVGYDNNSWYLDNLDVKWDAVYQNEPCKGIPTDDLCKLVLGGHGEMWGETVDSSDLQDTVWPKLGAIAEKLWSPRAATQNSVEAAARIHDFRCKLLERGIGAAPVDNQNARSAPRGPGSCYQTYELAAKSAGADVTFIV